MKVLHFEKGLRYSDTQRVLLARKLGRLATYCKSVQDASSTIRVEAMRRATEKTRDRVKVMITVELPHKILRAESRRGDVIDAVDRCIEKIEPQIKRYKELHTRKGYAQVRRRKGRH